MRLVGLLFLVVTAGMAGEYAVLSGSGTRLRIDRHEIDGPTVRLYTSAGGFLEMASTAVDRFEPDGELPNPVAPPVPAQPASASSTAPPAKPQDLADAAADRYGLPRKLVRSVMAAESGFNPRAVSPKGAVGLMQLMPGSAQMLGADPNDPAQNVDAGTRYLRDLLVRYNGMLWHALAAYNAGPGAVDKYNGLPPYRETLNYVNRIDRNYKR